MTKDIKVKLSVDGRQLEQGMNKAANSVTDFSEKTKQMSINVAQAGAAVAVAVAAIGASVLKMASEAAAAGVEIKNLSAQAGVGTTEFQKMAAASRTVGFEQEKLSDILKDVNDKFGDYMATGAGPLADFFEQIAPKIGVTADMFAKLSGPDALQLYVSSLEKAGVSQQQMTFYMEALASDATALIPLLRDNGREMSRLGREAEEAGRFLSEEMIANAVELDGVLAALSTTLRVKATAAVLEYTDEIEDLVNFITEKLIPTIGGFLKWVGDGVEGWRIIGRAAEDYATKLRDLITLKGEFGGFDPFAQGLPTQEGLSDLQSYLDQTNVLPGGGGTEEFVKTISPQIWQGPQTPGGWMPSTSGAPFDPTGGLLAPVSPLDAARNAWGDATDDDDDDGGGKLAALGLTDEDFEELQARFETERELIASAQADQLAELQAFRDANIGQEEDYNDLEARIKEKHNKDMAALDRAAMKQKLSAYSGMFGDLSSLMQSENEKMFKVGKAAAIAKAVVDGISSASTAWNKGMSVAGLPGAIAFSAASVAKTGMMISQLQSASSSGGGGQSSSGGGSVSIPSSASRGGGGGSVAGQGQQDVTTFAFTLQNDPMGFGESFARQMIEQLNSTQRNGGQIRGVLNT